MIRSLRTAALGMSAQQLNVDVIANNLANVNTAGFKRSSVEFQDLLYETIQAGRLDGTEGHETPSEIQIGLGNRPVSTYRSFGQGEVTETGNSLDIAINGNGFLQIVRPDGSYGYTRDGALRINSDGDLVTSAGLTVYPEITLPPNIENIEIAQDGTISVLLQGEEQPETVGQLELAAFVNPAGLRAAGSNMYEQTEASGDPIYGRPGEEGMGEIMQGYVEKSNVDVVKEMINLIVAQRAYEINSKAVRTADELLAMTNNIKR